MKLEFSYSSFSLSLFLCFDGKCQAFGFPSASLVFSATTTEFIWVSSFSRENVEQKNWVSSCLTAKYHLFAFKLFSKNFLITLALARRSHFSQFCKIETSSRARTASWTCTQRERRRWRLLTNCAADDTSKSKQANLRLRWNDDFLHEIFLFSSSSIMTQRRPREITLGAFCWAFVIASGPPPRPLVQASILAIN